MDIDPNMGLNFAGAVVMALSITGVVSLLGFCLYKVFTLPPAE